MEMTGSAEQERLGPYHGRWEGYARLRALMAFWTVFAALVLRWPWLLLLMLRKHYTLHKAMLVMGDLKLFYIVFFSYMGVLGIWSGYSLYQKLSRRIEQGGPEAEFLDRVRNDFTLVLGIGSFLFFWLMMPSGLTAAR